MLFELPCALNKRHFTKVQSILSFDKTILLCIPSFSQRSSDLLSDIYRAYYFENHPFNNFFKVILQQLTLGHNLQNKVQTENDIQFKCKYLLSFRFSVNPLSLQSAKGTSSRILTVNTLCMVYLNFFLKKENYITITLNTIKIILNIT